MIYITNTSFLSGSFQPQANEDNPIVFYKSILRPEDIIGDEYNPDRPLINMWNPDTASVWSGLSLENPTTPISITYEITLANPSSLSVNYIAICAHNLGTTGYSVKLEQSTDSGATWTEIVPVHSIVDDSPYVGFFNSTTATMLRVLISKSSVGIPAILPAPIIAHIKMGSAFVLQRRIYVGYEPTAIKAKTIENGSDNGQFLGQIIIRKYRQPGSIKQENNTPEFVRDNVYPFFEHCNGIPYYDGSAATTFVFAWRPTRFPSEIAYCWPTGLNYPTNQGSDSMGGRMQWSIDLGATL